MAAYRKVVLAIEPLLNKTHGDFLGTKTGRGTCDFSCIDWKSAKLNTVVQGIGTKLRVANDLGRFENIGLDLAALCVNELVSRRATPLFMLDYFATNKLDVDRVYEVVKGISEGCCKANVALLDCSISELPGLLVSDACDLAGFAVGLIRAPDPETIVEGDVLIGLPSSGIHCNGFSLVRSALKTRRLSLKAKAPWQSHNSVGESILTAAYTYDQVINVLDKVKGIQHVTYGGLFRMEFVPKHLMCMFQTALWEFPAFYRWMLQDGHLLCSELASTFNCGLGMVLCVRADLSSDVMEALKVCEPRIVGSIRPRNDNGDAVVLNDAAQNWMNQQHSPENSDIDHDFGGA